MRQPDGRQITVHRRAANGDSSLGQPTPQFVQRLIRIGCNQLTDQPIMLGQGKSPVTTHLAWFQIAGLFPALHQFDRGTLTDCEASRCGSP
jgi:hypothetical protein